MKIRKMLKRVTACMLTCALAATTVTTAPVNASQNADTVNVVSTSVEEEGISAQADESVLPVSGVDGDLNWSIDEDGLLTITGNGDYGECQSYDTNNDGYTDCYGPAWIEYRDYILKAEVNVKNITSTAYMFAFCEQIESIDLSGFDTSKVTDMQSMFSYCTKLPSINLSLFDTSKVTNMRYMFKYCESLTSLDISSFDTSNVTDMYDLFYCCDGLTSLDISSFDTSKVTNMHGMFGACNFTSIDLSSLDTSNVTDMSDMFFSCVDLTSLDISSFDTSNVTNMAYMFANCRSLTCLDLSTLDTSNVTDMASMFCYCKSLISLDLSSFDTSNVTKMADMFSVCSNLTILNLNSFDTSNVTDMGVMFYKCRSPTSLNLSTFDTSSVTDMGSMFYDCESLTSLDLSSFDTSNVTDMRGMFQGCTDLSTSITLTGDYTSYSECFCDAATASDAAIYVSYSGNCTKEMAQAIVNTKSSDSHVYLKEDGGSSGESGSDTKPTKAKVTEPMLFTTSNFKYLTNNSYNTMIEKLRDDESDILSNQGWSDQNITLKTVLSNGFTGNLKEIYHSLMQDNYRENKIHKELALAYVNKANDTTGLTAGLNTVVSELKKSKEVVDILQKGTAKADEWKLLAEYIADGTTSTVVNWKDLYEEELKLGKDATVLSSISTALKASGWVLTSTEIVAYICILHTTSIEQIEYYMSLVPEDSDFYAGLEAVRDDLVNGDIVTFAKELFEQKGIDEILGVVQDAVLSKVDGLGGAVAVVDFSSKLAGYLMEKNGCMDVDEWMKAYFNMGDQMVLRSALEGVRLNIIKNVNGLTSYDPDELQKQYESLWKLYVSSVLQAAEYLENYSSDKTYFATLQKDIKNYSSRLNYANYIASCLANANNAYTYSVNADGKAVISSSGTSAAKAAASTGTLTEQSLVYADASESTETSDGDEEETAVSTCIDIPSEIDGYEVAGVESGVFDNNEEIEIVSVPDTVTSIGISAFENCTNLTEVFLPDSLTTISENAFAGCSGMTAVDIPDTVTEIADTAFDGIDAITLTCKEDSQAQNLNSDSVTIVNREKTLSGITVKTMPDKTTCTMSEDPDLTGLVLTAEYIDGSTEEITEGYCGIFEDKQIGSSDLTIGYETVSTTITITVTADECEYTVYCVDENGENLVDPETGTALAGEAITIPAPEMEGYEAQQISITQTIGYFNQFIFTYSEEELPNVLDAEVAFTNSLIATGEILEPAVTVVYGGTTLTENVDYTVEYSDNVEPGTGYIWIIGCGNYSGLALYNFIIQSADGYFITRLAGDTRYDTAIESADELKEVLGVDRFDNVVIASGVNFPDALAGSPLATELDAPILLVGSNDANKSQAAGTAKTIEYIEENLTEGGTVYILGGTSAVSEQTEETLQDAGFETKRLAGDNRYETNLEIISQMELYEGMDVVIVRGYTSYKTAADKAKKTNPQGYADSLSVSGVAGYYGMPIILAGEKGLTDDQLDLLAQLKPDHIYVIGGTSAVSDAVYDQIDDATTGTMKRLAGDDRYKTSVAIAEEFGMESADAAVIAYGQNYPDGLTGGVLAAKLGAPLLLAENGKTSVQQAFLKESTITELYILGGTGVLPDSVVSALAE